MTLQTRTSRLGRVAPTQARLLIRPRPLAGEDLHHFLQRVANANGLSGISRVLGTRGLAFHGQRQSSWYKTLGTLLNASPDVLEHMDICPDRNAGKRQRFWYHGHSLHVHHIHQHAPRICPSCLKERGHGQAIWAITAMTACPEHDNLLLDTCPRCDRPLSWRRPDLFRCPCGNDLRESPVHTAPPGLLALCRSLAHAFLPEVYPAIHVEKIPPEFASLPLHDLLYLIDGLGRYFSAQDRGQAQLGRRHIAAVRHQAMVIQQVATLLAQWPDGLHQALKALPRDVPQEDALWSWQRFAQVHGEFFEFAMHEQTPEFLRNATRQYIEAHRVAGHGWERYRPPGTADGETTANEAKLPFSFRKASIARHLGVSVSAVNHLIHGGRIEYLTPNGIIGGVFTAVELAALAEEVEHAISAVDAATILNINHHQFTCLAGAGLVKPVYGSDRGSQYGHYSPKALRMLIEKVRGALKTGQAAQAYGWLPLREFYPNRPRPNHRFAQLVLAIIEGQLPAHAGENSDGIGTLQILPEDARRLGLYFPYPPRRRT